MNVSDQKYQKLMLKYRVHIALAVRIFLQRCFREPNKSDSDHAVR
jgi:hypothetical protein